MLKDMIFKKKLTYENEKAQLSWKLAIKLQFFTWASLILAVLYPFSENKFASFFLNEIGICLIRVHKYGNNI